MPLLVYFRQLIDQSRLFELSFAHLCPGFGSFLFPSRFGFFFSFIFFYLRGAWQKFMYVINKIQEKDRAKGQTPHNVMPNWKRTGKRKKKKTSTTIYCKEIEKILFVILHSTWLISLNDDAAVARRHLISFVVVHPASLHPYALRVVFCNARNFYVLNTFRWQ